jgi:hypothetical protein
MAPSSAAVNSFGRDRVGMADKDGDIGLNIEKICNHGERQLPYL